MTDTQAIPIEAGQRRKTGPPKLYDYVGRTPITMKLTPEGVGLLDRECERTGLKRADLVEYLVRHYGEQVPAGLLEQKRAG